MAFVGLPNVGKSSLLNALLHGPSRAEAGAGAGDRSYPRLIASDVAGTTRDAVLVDYEVRRRPMCIRVGVKGRLIGSTVEHDIPIFTPDDDSGAGGGCGWWTRRASGRRGGGTTATSWSAWRWTKRCGRFAMPMCVRACVCVCV